MNQNIPMKNLIILSFAAILMVAQPFATLAQTYYRIASNFGQLKLDNVPIAKSTITLDFEYRDSLKIAGKTFYARFTKKGNRFFVSSDKSLFSYFSDEELTGFIVTTPPGQYGARECSVYFRYKKASKASKVPPPEDTDYYIKKVNDHYNNMVDPRAKTYYSVIYELKDDDRNFGGEVQQTCNFVLLLPDTILMDRLIFKRVHENFFEAKNAVGNMYNGGIRLYTMDNGAIVVTEYMQHMFREAIGYFAPTKEIAEKLLSENFNAQPLVKELTTKADAIKSRLSKEQTDKEKIEREAELKIGITNLIASLKSVRSEPAIELEIRKQLVNKEIPTLSVQRIYFLDDSWQIIRDVYDQIVRKQLRCFVMFKDSKSGACYVRYWTIQYPHMGGGTYATEFEFGTTYPSRQNTSIQNSYVDVYDSKGIRRNLYAGNWYEFDCKAIQK